MKQFAGWLLVVVTLARIREDLRRVEATQDRLVRIWAHAIEAAQ